VKIRVWILKKKQTKGDGDKVKNLKREGKTRKSSAAFVVSESMQQKVKALER
jgi:hypothetical protein